MKVIKKLLPFLKNRYIILTLIFIVVILFVDGNNIISQVRLTKKLNKLEEDVVYYKSEIEKDKKALYDLQTNPKNLERFGRENYIMKKDDEDVFIIEEAAAD